MEISWFHPSIPCFEEPVQERETFDLFGSYSGHPHPRVLMPEDWVGYPLRKDYVQSTFTSSKTPTISRSDASHGPVAHAASARLRPHVGVTLAACPLLCCWGLVPSSMIRSLLLESVQITAQVQLRAPGSSPIPAQQEACLASTASKRRCCTPMRRVGSIAQMSAHIQAVGFPRLGHQLQM